MESELEENPERRVERLLREQNKARRLLESVERALQKSHDHPTPIADVPPSSFQSLGSAHSGGKQESFYQPKSAGSPPRLEAGERSTGQTVGRVPAEEHTDGIQ